MTEVIDAKGSTTEKKQPHYILRRTATRTTVQMQSMLSIYERRTVQELRKNRGRTREKRQEARWREELTGGVGWHELPAVRDGVRTIFRRRDARHLGGAPCFDALRGDGVLCAEEGSNGVVRKKMVNAGERKVYSSSSIY